MMNNRRLLVYGGIGVILVAGLVYFFTQSPSGDTTSAPVTATATTIKKNLSVLPLGSAAAEEIPESAKVSEGDRLTTSSEGRGLVTMSNGSTAILDYSSTLEIKGIDKTGGRTSLSLMAGSVWARVEKVFGQGEYFEIKTRNAVAVVRGTSFGITVHADGSTTLLVGKGEVALTPVDPVTGELEEGKTLTLGAGKKGMVFSDGSTSESAFEAADTSSEWFLYNNADNFQVPQTAPISAPAKPATPKLDQPVSSPPSTQTSVTPTALPPVPDTSGSGAGSGDSSTAGSGDNTCASFSETGGSATQGSSLKLSSVSPSSASRRAGTTVTLSGDGFTCVTTITVGGTVLNGESGFVVANNSTITFSASSLSTGTHDIIMADTLGSVAAKPAALTVTE